MQHGQRRRRRRALAAWWRRATGLVLAVLSMLGGTATVAATAAHGAPLPHPAGRLPATGGYRGGGPVGVRGDQLTLLGAPHVYVGVDAYEAATDWGVDNGCGAMLSDTQLDDMFASLPAHALVRVWAFQGSMGTDPVTHAVDWTGLDRVMAAAATYDDDVILVLGDQGGTCDSGIWQDPDWYRGGYRQVQDPTGETPLSYWAYLKLAVAHFRSAPALAMWEPMSEAQASACPSGQVSDGYCAGGETCVDEGDSALALRSFYDTVGAEIQRLDPRHPVESGLLGDGGCGTEGPDWSYVSESPGINVLSYHDYTRPANPLGGAGDDSIAVRLAEARTIGKPVIAGEVGVEAGTATTACPDPAGRAADFTAKIDAQVERGAAAVLLWDYTPDAPAPGTCSYDIPPGDPALAALARLGAAGT